MSDSHFQLFADIFGFDLRQKTERQISWIPSLGELITFDPQSNAWKIPIAWMDEEDRVEFVEALNYLLARSAGKEAEDNIPAYAYPAKESTAKPEQVFIDLKTLQMLAAQKSEREKKNLDQELPDLYQRLFKNYLEPYKKFELLRVPKDAFNLDLQRQGNMAFEWITRTSDGNKLPNTWALFFCGAGGIQYGLKGYDVLAHNLEAVLTRAAQFLTGPIELNEKQRAAVATVFGADGKGTPLIRIPKEGGGYFLALNMDDARALGDSGLYVDLGTIFQHHCAFLSDGVHASLSGEGDSARRVILNHTGLGAYAEERVWCYQGEKIFSFSVDAASGSYDPETGRKTDEDAEQFDLFIWPKFLYPSEKKAFDKAIAAELKLRLAEAEIEWGDASEGRRHIPYDPIETLMRRRQTIDLRAVFQSYAETQCARIDRIKALQTSIADSFGYGGFRGSQGYDDDFYREEDVNEVDFVFRFERNLPATVSDHPEQKDIFADIASQMQAVIQDTGLGENIEISSYAGGRSGNFIPHRLSITLAMTSLEHGEEMAKILASMKERLLPIIEEAVAISCITCVFDRDLLGVGEKGPQADLKNRLSCGGAFVDIYTLTGAIEANRQARGCYIGNIRGFIADLVGFKNDDNPQIAEIAAKELTVIQGLSPVFASLIARAELGYIPARRSNEPLLSRRAPQLGAGD